ncbi:MAG: hypothetical protein HOK21_24930 [Rhodospirillaceae bacterium]|nr:hypothetical protein [Rhodospirillaceae bacterium]
MSVNHTANQDRQTDRRWTKVAFAFLLLLGATVVVAQESHSNAAPEARHTAHQY